MSAQSTNMQVLIITEGSSDIGFGHITRCTSLYQAFEKKGIIPEFIINGDEIVNSLLNGKRCNLLDWLKNRKKLYSLVKGSNIVVIDSYLADSDFYDDISSIVKLSVYIDDNKRIDYPKGIVVNGTIFAEKMDYPKREGVIYLLGSRYIPVRREFWEVQERRTRNSIESVIITFGGDDSRNMTPKVLKLLVDNYPELTKNVIVGKGIQDINVLEEIKDNNTNLLHYPNAEGMKNIMLESDIAISAAGQTLYELARTGVPTIAIAVADNQLNNIKGWHKAEFIEYAGWWKDGDVLDNTLNCLKKVEKKSIRERMSKIGCLIVDGRGAERIVQKILENMN